MDEVIVSANHACSRYDRLWSTVGHGDCSILSEEISVELENES
jgi:hypothetical protein